jgi:hypothetical protein
MHHRQPTQRGAPEPLTRRTMQKVIRCIRTLMPVSVPEFEIAISLLPFCIFSSYMMISELAVLMQVSVLK